jgi:hypothetical protein
LNFGEIGLAFGPTSSTIINTYNDYNALELSNDTWNEIAKTLEIRELFIVFLRGFFMIMIPLH